MARQLANAVFLPGMGPLAPCLAVFYEKSEGEKKRKLSLRFPQVVLAHPRIARLSADVIQLPDIRFAVIVKHFPAISVSVKTNIFGVLLACRPTFHRETSFLYTFCLLLSLPLFRIINPSSIAHMYVAAITLCSTGSFIRRSWI